MTGRKCYLAGPMRGLPQLNFPAFFDAAQKLRDAGWFVFCPAELDIKANIEIKDIYSAEETRNIAKRDIDIILNELRSENNDAIVMLSGCENSLGATAEISIARWVLLQVLTINEALKG